MALLTSQQVRDFGETARIYFSPDNGDVTVNLIPALIVSLIALFGK